MKNHDARLEDVVATTLRRHLPHAGAPDLSLDIPLTDLGLDSLSVVNLMLDLEDTLGITFPEEMLNEETFRTGRSVVAAVQALADAG